MSIYNGWRPRDDATRQIAEHHRDSVEVNAVGIARPLMVSPRVDVAVEYATGGEEHALECLEAAYEDVRRQITANRRGD